MRDTFIERPFQKRPWSLVSPEERERLLDDLISRINVHYSDVAQEMKEHRDAAMKALGEKIITSYQQEREKLSSQSLHGYT